MDPRRKGILADIVIQTIDCAYLVGEYSLENSFCMFLAASSSSFTDDLLRSPVLRAIKEMLSDIDDKIQAYKDTIAGLVIAFDQHAIVSIEKQVFRVLRGVETIGMFSSVLGAFTE